MSSIWILPVILVPGIPFFDKTQAPIGCIETAEGIYRIRLDTGQAVRVVRPHDLPEGWIVISRQAVSSDGKIRLTWDLATKGDDRLLARIKVENLGLVPVALVEASPLSFGLKCDWKGGQVLSFDTETFGYNRNSGLEPLIEGEQSGGAFATALNKPALVAGFVTTRCTLGRSYVTPRSDGIQFVAKQPADGAILLPGRSRQFEWLFASLGKSPTRELELLGSLMAHFNKPRLKHKPFATWCTWYSSMVWPKSANGELERFVLDQLKELQPYRPLGLKTVRVVEDAPYWGRIDYPLITDGLPSGYPSIAKSAQAHGFSVGAWFDNTRSLVTTDAAQKHPEWFAKGPDGNPLRRETANGYPDHYTIDPSTEGGRYLYRELPKRYREAGISYLFSDFTWNGLLAPSQTHDPASTSVESLRKGMLAFRQGFGNRGYWLGQQLQGANWDLVDAMRVSVDSWGTERSSYRNARNLWFLHHKLFLCDPDSWRPDKASLPWARSWISWQVLGGHPITIGGDLRTFSREQKEILRRALPTLDSRSRPLDLWARRTGYASAQSFRRGDTKWTTVVLSNYRSSPVNLVLKVKGRFLARSFWQERFLGVWRNKIERTLPGDQGEALMLYPDLGRPQIISVGDHLEQGAYSLLDSSWNPKRRRLSLHVRPFVPGDPLAVEVFVPKGWTCLSSTIPIVKAASSPFGTVFILRLEAQSSYRCEISFQGNEKASSEVATPPLVSLAAKACLPQVSRANREYGASEPELLVAKPNECFDIESVQGAVFAVEKGYRYDADDKIGPGLGHSVWYDSYQLQFRIAPEVCKMANRVGILLADPDSNERKADVLIGLGEGSRLSLIKADVPCRSSVSSKTREIWALVPLGAQVKGLRLRVVRKAGANATVARIRLIRYSKPSRPACTRSLQQK